MRALCLIIVLRKSWMVLSVEDIANTLLFDFHEKTNEHQVLLTELFLNKYLNI